MTTTTIGLERVGTAGVLRIAGDVTTASETDLMDGFSSQGYVSPR